MIGALVTALRPVYAPLLKLSLQPPELPEGGVVRTLKPSEGYLTYLYLQAFSVSIAHAWPAVVVTIAAVAGLGKWGVLVGLLAFAISGFILGLQLVTVRLDWELRHYVIGEHSLRVREGAWVTQEVTLSYANVQNVEVVQGPLQRWLGFESLRVTTAGGGGRGPQDEAGHGALLVGLTHAEELRQLIVARMKAQKDSGLGDLDEARRAASPSAALSQAGLREVLEAARELRAAAERVGPRS